MVLGVLVVLGGVGITKWEMSDEVMYAMWSEGTSGGGVCEWCRSVGSVDGVGWRRDNRRWEMGNDADGLDGDCVISSAKSTRTGKESIISLGWLTECIGKGKRADRTNRTVTKYHQTPSELPETWHRGADGGAELTVTPQEIADGEERQV